jgi:hypothetical protein
MFISTNVSNVGNELTALLLRILNACTSNLGPKTGHHDGYFGGFPQFLQLNVGTEKKTKKLNSVAVVRKRAIPTERPPLVSEVSANLLQVEGVALSAQRMSGQYVKISHDRFLSHPFQFII